MARWTVYVPDELDQKLREFNQRKYGVRTHGALTKTIQVAVEEYLKRGAKRSREGV